MPPLPSREGARGVSARLPRTLVLAVCACCALGGGPGALCPSGLSRPCPCIPAWPPPTPPPMLRLRGSGVHSERPASGEHRGWASVRGVGKGDKETKSGRGPSRDRAREPAHRKIKGRSRGERQGEEREETEAENTREKQPIQVGKHLVPIVRVKKSETVLPAAKVVAIDEALARIRLKSRSRDAAEGLIRVSVDERRQAAGAGDGPWAPGVLRATPKELARLSKGALLKLAKQSGLKVVCKDKSLLSNRDVRKALEPFLPNEDTLRALDASRACLTATPLGRIKGRMHEKSKFLSSVWIDGEERSVYGSGRPKDSDFLAWAAECVEELEEREHVEPTGPPRSKKQRQQLIHDTALHFSDQVI